MREWAVFAACALALLGIESALALASRALAVTLS